MSGGPARPRGGTEAAAQALELAAALQRFGWEREGGDPGRYESWVSRRDRRLPEILVPLDASKGDFGHLLRQARNALVHTVGTEAEAFLEALHRRFSAALDATRFRKETALASGMIAWDQGQELFDAARASLVAAAKASRAKRRYHGNSGSFIARNFIESSLMGQTEVGSFIVTAYTPAAERFFLTKADEVGPTRLDDIVTLSGRQILQTLETALLTTRSALEEYRRAPRVELFGEAVQDGVSYELVMALTQLAAGADESGVTLEYAPPLLEATSRSVDVSFVASDTSILSRAANFLARERTTEEVTLTGRVTLLDRPSPDEVGVIRLDVLEGTEARKVRVRLEADAYNFALEAHRENTVLTVRGRLEREGQNYWLYDVESLDVRRVEELRAPDQLALDTGEQSLGGPDEDDTN